MAIIGQAIEIASRPSPDRSDRIGVDYAFDGANHRFSMWQGHGNHAMSTPVSAAQALAEWQPHLLAAGAQWLLPWLARIAAGEAIDPAAILEVAAAHSAD